MKNRSKSKLIWIINPSDAIPGDKWGYKHGMFLAKILSENGYDVIFWVSSFSHTNKVQRCVIWKDIIINKKLTIRIVPTSEYKSHIGFSRVLSLIIFSIRILLKGLKSKSPNFIFLTIPLILGDVFTVWLNKYHKSKLIVEFRDLWPEIFVIALPIWLRRFSKLIFYPLYSLRSYTFKNSSGFVSVCETYKKIAFIQNPELNLKPNEVVYHTSFELNKFHKLMANTSMDNNLLQKEHGTFWAIYAGTIGNNYDIDTLLKASEYISEISPNIMILVAGDGPLLNKIESFINSRVKSNLVYIGTLDMSTLCRYYEKSDLGLSLYSPTSTVAMPAKAYDYIAAELPIINSLSGEFSDFIHENEIGYFYKSGDPNSLAEVLIKAVKDIETLKKMKANLKLIAPQFDRKIQYRKILNMIDSLV